MNLVNRLYEMLGSGTERAWRDNLIALVQSYGYSQVLYGIVPNKWAPLEVAFLCSNYAPEWRQKYDAGKFHQYDPTVSHCLNNAVPMIWGESDFASKVQKKFYEEARCYRIHQGISYPVHGANGEFGMISFVSDEFSDRSFHHHLKQQMPDLALIRDFAYQSSLRFTRFPEQPQVAPVLTGRELECLNWATAGKSSWEISRILGCSEATVNFHFSNLRRKFNVTTRQQAIVKGIRLGLISP